MSFPVTEKPEFWKGNGAYLLATANAWPPALLRTREGTGHAKGQVNRGLSANILMEW
jgi:hypothetical protein